MSKRKLGDTLISEEEEDDDSPDLEERADGDSSGINNKNASTLVGKLVATSKSSRRFSDAKDRLYIDHANILASTAENPVSWETVWRAPAAMAIILGNCSDVAKRDFHRILEGKSESTCIEKRISSSVKYHERIKKAKAYELNLDGHSSSKHEAKTWNAVEELAHAYVNDLLLANSSFDHSNAEETARQNTAEYMNLITLHKVKVDFTFDMEVLKDLGDKMIIEIRHMTHWGAISENHTTLQAFYELAQAAEPVDLNSTLDHFSLGTAIINVEQKSSKLWFEDILYKRGEKEGGLLSDSSHFDGDKEQGTSSSSKKAEKSSNEVGSFGVVSSFQNLISFLFADIPRQNDQF